MSVIRKKPYIETLIGRLNDAEIATLTNVMNNAGTVHKSLVDSNYFLDSEETPAIYGVDMELELGNVKTGILVHITKSNIDYCVLLAYHQYQDMKIYELQKSNGKYRKFKVIDEYLNIEELRRIISVVVAESGAATEWELAIKEYVIQNGSTTEVGGDIEIDGMIKCDEIYSKTEVSEENVPLAEFDPSDNHWHLTNTKVDDTLLIEGELELGDGDLGADLQAKIKEIAGYTAGDGISIDENGVIKAEVGTGLFLDDTGIHLNNASQNAINAVAGKVNTSDILDNVISTDTDKPLSANQGKLLNERINYVEARGRFLSTWNASTGKPATLPSDIATTAYTYKTGDYFIVGTAGSKVPSGTSVPAGTTIDTFPSVSGASSAVNDTILFDGTNWNVIHTDVPTVTFGSITGNVSDNSALVSAFAGKQNTIDSSHKLSYAYISGTPTVDTTYNASSSNAQSGTAVASAIASAITTTINGNY